MGDEQAEEIADKVKVGRRDFVKRMMVGSAFAVPLVASFTMGNISCSGGFPGNQSKP
jgi:hypothetical protein